MKFSTSVRYAVRIIFTLHEAGRPVSVAAIAERTGVAPHTVEKIHAVLQKNGITAGMIGSRGGIRLAQPVDGVSLGKLLEILDGGVAFAVCCGEKTNRCPGAQSDCPRYSAWKAFSDRTQAFFDTVFLTEFLGK
jgi:Rrf2 family protein